MERTAVTVVQHNSTTGGKRTGQRGIIRSYDLRETADGLLYVAILVDFTQDDALPRPENKAEFLIHSDPERESDILQVVYE